MIHPTYYVRHPDGSYAEADPQPVQQEPVAWLCCVPGQDPCLLFDEPSDERYPPGYKDPLVPAAGAQDKQEITYAYKGSPNGQRFRQYAKDTIPDWAVDVRPVQAPACASKTAESDTQANLTIKPDAQKQGKWYAAEDIDGMTRELDVAMTGDGAAKQAMLCDLMPPLLALIKSAQERKPLSIERLREIERDHVYSQTATLVQFARAIEAAHGIGEQA